MTNEYVAIWTNGKARIGIMKYGNQFYTALSTDNGNGQTVCGSRMCKTERAARIQAGKWMKADKEVGGTGQWTKN